MARFVLPRKDQGSFERAPGLDDDAAEAQRRVRLTYIAFLEAVLDRLEMLQPEDTASVGEAVRLLVKTGILHSEIAVLLEVSRASVGRWADGTNVPRALGFRRAILNTAIDQVTQMREREQGLPRLRKTETEDDGGPASA